MALPALVVLNLGDGLIGHYDPNVPILFEWPYGTTTGCLGE